MRCTTTGSQVVPNPWAASIRQYPGIATAFMLDGPWRFIDMDNGPVPNVVLELAVGWQPSLVLGLEYAGDLALGDAQLVQCFKEIRYLLVAHATDTNEVGYQQTDIYTK